jgi:hypothetical protein
MVEKGFLKDPNDLPVALGQALRQKNVYYQYACPFGKRA